MPRPAPRVAPATTAILPRSAWWSGDHLIAEIMMSASTKRRHIRRSTDQEQYVQEVSGDVARRGRSNHRRAFVWSTRCSESFRIQVASAGADEWDRQIGRAHV